MKVIVEFTQLLIFLYYVFVHFMPQSSSSATQSRETTGNEGRESWGMTFSTNMNEGSCLS